MSLPAAFLILTSSSFLMNSMVALPQSARLANSRLLAIVSKVQQQEETALVKFPASGIWTPEVTLARGPSEPSQAGDDDVQHQHQMQHAFDLGLEQMLIESGLKTEKKARAPKDKTGTDEERSTAGWQKIWYKRVG